MNEMYSLGIAVGVLVAIFALALLKIFGKYNEEQKYDERQIREQGRANKLAYRFTLVGLAACLFADSFSDRFSVNIMPICIIAIICISVLIFAVYCILHDAYYGLDKMMSKKYVVLWIVVVLMNLVSLVVNIKAYGLVEDGKLNGTVLSSGMIVILFAGILIATLLHGKRKEEEDAEDWK